MSAAALSGHWRILGPKSPNAKNRGNALRPFRARNNAATASLAACSKFEIKMTVQKQAEWRKNLAAKVLK